MKGIRLFRSTSALHFRAGRCGAGHNPCMDMKWKLPVLWALHPSRHKAHEEQPPAAARARRFAAKNAPAGQRQIGTISATSARAGHGNDCLPAQPPPAAPAKDGFGRFTVSAACGADLVCLCRVSLPLSTSSPWSPLVAATPIPPSPAIRGRRV